jgi:hypothetical protein
MTSSVADLEALVAGARCWGVELEPRFRVLAVTVEPDPLRMSATPGERQLLCFPVSVLLVALTRDRPTPDDAPALLTFDLEQLTAVSQRFAGATIEAPVFGRPEPRPGTWGPRYSLEGRSSAADGTGMTLTLDLVDADARLRLFARCDDVELRDRSGSVELSTQATPRSPAASDDGLADGLGGRSREATAGSDPEGLRFS